MRRVLVLFFAMAAFMAVGATGALAAGGGGDKKPGCDNSGPGNNNDKPGCRRDDKRCDNSGPGNSHDKPGCRKPRDCKYGVGKDKKCKPKPCPGGEKRDAHGKCPPPKPEPCPGGGMRDAHGNCPPPNPCTGAHPPPSCKPPVNNCARADVVLLKDLLGPSGPAPRLVCLYFGENAANATKDKDCPDADLAVPLAPLVGACVFLRDPNGATPPGHGGSPLLPPLEVPELPKLPAPGGGAGAYDVTSVVSTVTGMLG